MTTKSRPLGDLPFWPRCLSADEAARYVGVSRNVFDAEVDKGIWPRGIPRGSLGAKMVWDRHALDRVLDEMSGLGGSNEVDGFERRRQAARSRESAKWPADVISRPKD